MHPVYYTHVYTHSTIECAQLYDIRCLRYYGVEHTMHVHRITVWPQNKHKTYHCVEAFNSIRNCFGQKFVPNNFVWVWLCVLCPSPTPSGGQIYVFRFCIVRHEFHIKKCHRRLQTILSTSTPHTHTLNIISVRFSFHFPAIFLFSFNSPIPVQSPLLYVLAVIFSMECLVILLLIFPCFRLASPHSRFYFYSVDKRPPWPHLLICSIWQFTISF